VNSKELSGRLERMADIVLRLISQLIDWVKKHPSLALVLLGLLLAAATPWQGSSILIPAFIFIITGVALYITSRLFSQQPVTTKASVVVERRDDQRLAVLLSKLLTEEEARVVEVLVESNGSMLQREIPYKTGLSKLKVHRIITRLASRGLLTKRKDNGKVIVTMDEELLRFLKEAGQSFRAGTKQP